MDKGAYYTPKAALDAVLANPPLGEADGRTLNQIFAETKTEGGGRNLIGIVQNKTTTLLYAFADGLDIEVTAREANGGMWHIEGRSHGELRISAYVFGGRWQAKKYAQFIRNGMVSRAKRLKGSRAKRAANAAERGE